jgi:AraC-like DNA-binding protein/mannose-6-phosphate isomerase-like protein (cupin superfamily)
MQPAENDLYHGFQFYIDESADTRLRIYVFGYHESEPERIVSEHSHNRFELHLLAKGSYVYKAGGEEITVREGDICITKPGEVHSMTGIAGEPWHIFYVQVEIAEPKELREIYNKSTVKRLTGCRDLIDDFSRIIEEAKSPGAASEYLQATMIYEMLIRLGRKLSLNEPAVPYAKDKYSEIADIAKWYIEEHTRHGLQIEEIAHHIGVSKSTLSHCFAEILNEPVCEYNRRMLMCRAQCLLEQSNMQISEIADELGYPSIHYFSTIFKARFGVSPREYRLQFRASRTRKV